MPESAWIQAMSGQICRCLQCYYACKLFCPQLHCMPCQEYFTFQSSSLHGECCTHRIGMILQYCGRHNICKLSANLQPNPSSRSPCGNFHCQNQGHSSNQSFRVQPAMAGPGFFANPLPQGSPHPSRSSPPAPGAGLGWMHKYFLDVVYLITAFGNYCTIQCNII